MQVSKENPVHHRRLGYADTGFAFHFARCHDHNALRDYVMKIPSARAEAWFKGPATEIPDGFTVCTADRVLPGLVPEAVGDFLCEVHVVVVADDDARKEKRRWHHEIGHACDFAGAHYIGALCAYNRSGEGSFISGPNSRIEVPAFCNELLCEAVDCMFEGDINPVVSGFKSLFPWLNKAACEAAEKGEA